MDGTGEVIVLSDVTAKEESSSVTSMSDTTSSYVTALVQRTDHDDSISNPSSDSDNLDLSINQNSEEGAKQPNSEVNSFVIPDKELVDKIVQQIEQYFSDESILKDPFLLKHVRRNKEGFVSLKLIASFRKVKSLTKDWRVVAYSLKQSDKLEVNEEETKVRRKNPLPAHDETTISRTVVAFNLPFDKPTVENVGEIFSKCGEISLIRILRPGNTLPPEVKRLLNKHPEIGEHICALVEFEKHESALNAVKLLNSENDCNLLQVLSIVQKLRKKETSTQAEKSQLSSPKQEKQMVESNGGKKKKRGKKQDRVEEIRGEEGDSPFTSSCSETENSPKPRKRSSGSVGSYYYLSQHRIDSNGYRRGSFGTPKSSPVNSPLIYRKVVENSVSYRPKSHSYCEGDLVATLSTSPWVQKRLLTANGHVNNCISSRLLIPEGIVRLPKGPNGTKGFTWNREQCNISAI